MGNMGVMVKGGGGVFRVASSDCRELQEWKIIAMEHSSSKAPWPHALPGQHDRYSFEGGDGERGGFRS